MDPLLELLGELEEKYQQLANLKEKALKTMPEGSLRITHQKKYIRYYHQCADTESYITKENRDLARLLAQKDYDEKVFQLAKRRSKQIHMLIRDYKPDEVEQLYQKLHPGRRKLVTPAVTSIAAYIEAWENVPYDKRVFDEDAPEYYTERGERVLSKSEKILADKFYTLQIPYRYEFPVFFRELGKVHPDFMLLNKRNRREFYWEHLGKMDDTDYADKAVKRLNVFQRNGILPGKNLILTYETGKRPLDMRVVERLLQAYLL